MDIIFFLYDMELKKVSNFVLILPYQILISYYI